jgi:O-antigen/teichoic acid export membrane protein
MTAAAGVPAAPGVPEPTGGAGHVSRHGRAMLAITVVSGIGILATTGFQLVVIRGLGPVEYGLLASFLAFINIASIGSGALRNSVAVTVAEARAKGTPAAPRGRLDGSTVEAIVLGVVCTLGVLLAAPLLGTGGAADVTALAFVALTATPYFLFSRAQGLLQGIGNSRAVVLWSTGAQIAQFVLSALAVALGAGATGVLTALLVTAVVGAVGTSVAAHRRGVLSGPRVFSVDSSVVIALTIAFAWLTSVDVVLVRAESEPAVAGAYAAAAVLIKTTLIIPATISLYLLPRFVSRRRDASMTMLGVNVTLGITVVAGVAMVGLVALWGEPLSTIFGGGYEDAAAMLPGFAVAWLPWALAQGLLVRLTAVSSRSALVVLVLAAAAQWFGGHAALPGVDRFILVNGIVGAVTFAALFAVHLVLARKDGRAAAQDTAQVSGSTTSG